MRRKDNKTIADCLLPTFENVTEEFINNTMYKILFSPKIPNFKFDFREKEAMDFIEKILREYSDKYVYHKKEVQEILTQLKEKTNENTTQPVMVVNNYREFFELLRQFYEQDIELYFQRTEMTGFPVYERDNCFEQIWLRATPDDFMNPEGFLRRQVDMLKDTTFEKYNEEVCFGKLSFLDDNIMCVKNEIARTWDENSKEIQIKIYDKNYYNNRELFDRPHYTLPVIRYGIYEQDGKKICHIGSIQNKNNEYRENTIRKKLDRKKYKLNKDVPEEETSKIEPKNLLALSIFINLLNREGITEIVAPGMYVLDYEYHEGKNDEMLNNFEKSWPEKKREEYPKIYKEMLFHFNNRYKKEDVISELKTERFLLTFRRLLYHYPNGNIKSYPGEADNFLHISIPIIKSENDIIGTMLRDLYKIVQHKYIEGER